MASVPPTDPSSPVVAQLVNPPADAPHAEAADPPGSPPPLGVDDAVQYLSNQETAAAADQAADDGPLRYHWRLPLLLLVLSCGSIFLAGCCRWVPSDVLWECLFGPYGNEYAFEFTPLRRAILSEWRTGLVFMASLISVLMSHELGHFIFTVIYRIRATLPLVIPLPISPFGTLGAVIAMEPGKANRREIFDIGIAGPLAGLVITLPVLWAGLQQIDFQEPAAGMLAIKPPLLMEWLLQYLHPAEWKAAKGEIWLSQANPLLVAGWIGLFFTGLNMFPVGQLDGGHITYTLMGRGAHWLARGLMVAAFAYMAYTGNTLLLLMAVLVMLIGTDHPPTGDDSVPLGWPRMVLGWVSLIIPILCLTPEAIIIA